MNKSEAIRAVIRKARGRTTPTPKQIQERLRAKKITVERSLCKVVLHRYRNEIRRQQQRIALRIAKQTKLIPSHEDEAIRETIKEFVGGMKYKAVRWRILKALPIVKQWLDADLRRTRLLFEFIASVRDACQLPTPRLHRKHAGLERLVRPHQTSLSAYSDPKVIAYLLRQNGRSQIDGLRVIHRHHPAPACINEELRGSVNALLDLGWGQKEINMLQRTVKRLNKGRQPKSPALPHLFLIFAAEKLGNVNLDWVQDQLENVRHQRIRAEMRSIK